MSRTLNTLPLIVAASLVAVTCAPPALAAPLREAAPKERACPFSPVSWVREDRLPPVVRSAPSWSAPIIGKILPEQLEGEDEARGVDLLVDRIAGDFVHIAAIPAVPESNLPAIPEGWVQQDSVYFTMQTAAGFARPNHNSRQTYAGDDWVYRRMIVRIVDCHGSWMKLVVAEDEDYDADAERTGKESFTTAWFRGFCGIAETTCDGVVGDNPR